MKNRFEAISLCLIALSLQSTGHAQGLQYLPKQNSLKSFASNVGGGILSFAITVSGDILYVFSSPFRLSQENGVKLLAFTTMTAASVTWLDGDIDEDFIERDEFYIKPATRLAVIGEGYDKFVSNKNMVAGLPIAMLAGGLIFKDKKLLQTSRLIVESFILSGEITKIAKGVFGRARPYTNEGPWKFAWFKFNAEQGWRSLPSGHVSSAFSILTVLAKQYDSWWMEIPAYTIGIGVACQRMESHNHWNADVILGGAIGYWVGSTLVSRYKQPAKSSSINPYMMGNRVGLLVKF